MVQDQQGQVSLRCPTCRRSTLLPQGSAVSDLQPAFHIHHLFEIQDAFEKVKEPQKVVCGNCTKDTRTATSYCRDCGEFICAACVDIHTQWGKLSKHEVVPLVEFEKKVKQLDALKKVTLYCSLHEGKELELYCETCEELICHNCIVKKHRDHQYDLVTDTFERQKGDIVASLEPVERHLENADKMLKQIEAQSKAAKAKRDAIATEIQQKTCELQEMLEKRKDELISQLDESTQQTLKDLATQKDEVETTQTQLASCLSFVRESLRTGSQGEVMKMKKGVVKQIREITGSIKSEKQLPPCNLLNIHFSVSPETAQSCQQFGVIGVKGTISAKKSYATGKGLEVALLGEDTTAVVHICTDEERVCLSPVNSLTCELISESVHNKINGTVLNMIEAGKYEIGYKATSRGRHKLHVKVEGEHIKGSPFPITVKLPMQKLGKELIKTIGEVKRPWGVTINQKNEILVVENGGNRVSIFSSKGEQIRSFGSRGSGNGQFISPRGIAVDDNGDILVADAENYRIQKFSADGQFITAVGTRVGGQLHFLGPVGIKIHPITKRIYVADCYHRIQILNPDLSYFSSFGSPGSVPGQLNYPWDVAFDSANNMYITDNGNDRIQVFTEDGKFLRKIGKEGAGKGELNHPAMITISENELYVSEYGNHRVSVFTTQGDYLTSFGTRGSGPQQFSNPYGIAVDQSGMVYVADHINNRIQVF